MRLFVSGGTGVLGRRAVPCLVAAGHDVRVVARSAEKSHEIAKVGGTPISVDLFDADAVARAIEGCDAILHLATNIPTGPAILTKRAWRTNDRLRAEAAPILAQAAVAAGVERYIGESITFPYVDGGATWISEDQPRTFFYGDRSTSDAETAAESVTSAGGTGVILRFAMFWADDSPHIDVVGQLAKRGISPLLGDEDGYTSFVHVDDAAAAVVAALHVPAGPYNVAEPEPATRRDHNRAMAAAANKSKLRSAPKLMVRAGGASVASLARSQRIQSTALCDASEWVPTRRIVDLWAELL